LRITWVNLTGTGFVRMCEVYSLTHDSDGWQRFEIGRLKAINRALIFNNYV